MGSLPLTFDVLDLLDVVGEAAAGEDEQQLDERHHEGDEGAREQQRQHGAHQHAPDGRLARWSRLIIEC